MPFTIRRDFNRRLWSTLLLFSLAGAGEGCGTWLGNPTNPDEEGGETEQKSIVTIDFRGMTSDTALLAAMVTVTGKDGRSAGTIELTRAVIALKDIEIRAGDEAVDSQDVDFRGPFVVDLLTNEVNPAPSETKIAPGFYREIRMKLAKLSKDDAGATEPELSGKSIDLAGTYHAASGESKAFAMSFELDEEFRVSDEKYGIRLAAGQESSLIFAFFLNRWFDFSNKETNGDDLDLGSVTADSIVLTEDGDEVEKKLHQVIKENIKRNAEFAKDRDGDGAIGQDDKETEGSGN